MQVPSPAAGVIEELLIPDGGRVEGGQPLFKLKKGGMLEAVTHAHNHGSLWDFNGALKLYRDSIE